jgi:hypothetical protein
LLRVGLINQTYKKQGEKIMRFLIITIVFVLASTCFAMERHHGPTFGHGPYYHGSYYYPCVRPVVVGSAGGYYETRTETVMVAPERIERQWVEPVFVIRHDSEGRSYSVKLSDGYFREVVIPARYETRTVQVWVPVTYAAPVYVAPVPSVVGGAFYHGRHVSVGVGFGF